MRTLLRTGLAGMFVAAAIFSGCEHRPTNGIYIPNERAQMQLHLPEAQEHISYTVELRSTKTGDVPKSIEVRIGDEQQRMKCYYFDADASGSLLDHDEDVIITYSYLDKVLPGTPAMRLGNTFGVEMQFGKNYFISLDGKTYGPVADPVLAEHFTQSRTQANLENAYYQQLRLHILPAKTKDRFK